MNNWAIVHGYCTPAISKLLCFQLSVIGRAVSTITDFWSATNGSECVIIIHYRQITWSHGNWLWSNENVNKLDGEVLAWLSVWDEV